MDHQKHNRRSTNPHHVPKRNKSENEQIQDKLQLPTQPFHPTNNNRDEWRAYWQAQGWSWRTEPEISKERQEELARRRAIPVDIEKGIYPFGGMKLDRADVEWLLATHENGRGPVVWSDEHRNQEGLDLRGADLRGDENSTTNLRNLPLTRLRGGLTREENVRVSEKLRIKAHIQLEGAHLSGAKLEGANLHGAKLEGANLSRAKLEGADLRDAQLEGAILMVAKLKEADLRGAQLERADLSGADLTGAQLERANLSGVILSNQDDIGPFLADVQWGTTNLAVVDWSQVVLLGEEHVAQLKSEDDYKARYTRLEEYQAITRTTQPFSDALPGEDFFARLQRLAEEQMKYTRLKKYQVAVRATRQLAVALSEQGLNEDAVRFAYRVNVLQRSVYWYQMFDLQGRQNEEDEKKPTLGERVKRWFVALALPQRVQRFGSYSFSLFLDVLAGYGYKPERTVGWYLFVVFGFALAYALFGHLPFWPDALVYSLTSFHGRGFLPNLDEQVVTLHYPLVVMAAFEAVIGLLIEVSFIATFTQRFFGK